MLKPKISSVKVGSDFADVRTAIDTMIQKWNGVSKTTNSVGIMVIPAEEIVDFIAEKDLSKGVEYKKVVRLTTKSDYKKYLANKKDADRAIIKCNELIEKYNLNMKIIDASYTFDREQLIFRFLADDRVDFRQLAKDSSLFNIYYAGIRKLMTSCSTFT